MPFYLFYWENMKKFLVYLIGIVLVLSVKCLSAQGLKVIYEESRKSTISNPNLSSIGSPEMRERIEKKLKEMSAEKKNAELVIGNNVSLYTILETPSAEPKPDIENFLDNNENNTKVISKTTIKQVVMYKSYYKNLAENQILVQAEFQDKSYIVDYSQISIKWSIQKEEKIIVGYKCIKATKGDIVAWYCPEIPINDGPQFFYGLPGLILEIEIKSGINAIYSATSVTALTDVPEIQIGEGEKIDKEKFDEMLKEEVKSRGGPTTKTTIRKL
jgi:GLPGLI family protein